MKQNLLFILAIFSFLSLEAQLKIREKKYPSLLWEISGRDMKKPSYLIGTMHVSSKLAFHLPDSFYVAIRNAEVVALETNPETWQEDMSKYDMTGGSANVSGNSYLDNYQSIPNEYLHIYTLKFYDYERKIKRALSSSPSTINNLLYRSYGNESSDFEEDTYLDMYIFQCGKKWGKKVTGVENYDESMKLMSEAYKDAVRDKNKKERSYEEAGDYSVDKLQEAYRNGNLDLLDTINKYNSTSAAFDEKFLYRRNEIQARSIDSIIQSGSSMFAGVGAAHLPGERGVIELLRKIGYKLRPVKMGERNSRDKDLVDKIRVPVSFHTRVADDSLFTVDIPGKFYQYGDDKALEQKEYADMANGSYYMVTRIMTNAWLWSHGVEDVYKKVDSLLYENVPGKIISKTAIIKNGYKGFDITNRTRRGDLQRYNIFVTPFEIILFKMSGNGDYVKMGNEAGNFFSSIRFKEFQTVKDPGMRSWKKFSPPHGGFTVDLPHKPYTGNDGSWIYDAGDITSGTQYRVIRTDIHNYHFVEEDTFDLSLMNESFMASEFINSQLLRKHINYKGYPALDGKYKDKSGGIFLTRFIIQGPHYYTLIAHGKREIPVMKDFLNSFEISPFIYNEARQQRDTSLYYSVTTPVFPYSNKIKLDLPRFDYSARDDDNEESEEELLESGAYRNMTISNDTTGEKIYISFYRAPGYYYAKDSAAMARGNEFSIFSDSSWIFRLKRESELPNKMKVWETIVTDTGSSRTIWTKTFYKDGIQFSLATGSDTLTPPSGFVKKFYETFTPADTLKGVNPFDKKSNLFFENFFSADSAAHKRAVKHIADIYLDSTDLPPLKKAIARLNWNEKKYLDTKKSLIEKLCDIPVPACSDYLKELYDALDDTIQLQYPVLEGLLQHNTKYAYGVFRDIINNDPPVLETGEPGYDYSIYRPLTSLENPGRNRYGNGNFLDELSDSLQLTRTILPDLLPLLNLEDYKSSLMELLGEMIDSNLVKMEDYEMYFSKFLIEAKQELKKQAIAEKKRAIQKAEDSKKENKSTSYDEVDEKDTGNEDLSLYATLLLPFRETRPVVQNLLEQMLASNDKKLKYRTMVLLLRHNQPFPDSLLDYFAGLDDYRYELYKDLKEMSRSNLFPEAYNNHLALGKSELLDKKYYGKPDSVVYIDRLGAEYKNKKGFMYFYKYKARKDDLDWKLAVVGLVPDDPKQFEYDNHSPSRLSGLDYPFFSYANFNPYDFTDFTDTKIVEDEPLLKQLSKALKILLYSRRKSAKKFYDTDRDRVPERDFTY